MNKKKTDKLIIIITVILFFALLYFCLDLFGFSDYRNVQAIATSNDSEELKILKNKNPINIDKVINENKNIDIREEMTYEKLDLEYTTTYENNDKLPSGTIHVSQLGMTGTQDVITIKRFKGEELISEQIVANNIINSPVDKIVEIGTGRRKK